ncbi:FecR family protein [Desulfomicrobium salsuginis]
MKTFFLFALTLLLSVTAARAGQSTAGVIKSLEGKAAILRDGRQIEAKIGDTLHVGDTVTTEATGSAGIMLEDNTLVSLGPGSRLDLNDFAFEPQNGLFAVAIKLIKGSFAYMSGIIGHLAPEKIRIETPDAVIAVHGTRFLVNVEDAR